MSRQRARIVALEKRTLQETEPPLLLIKFCEGGRDTRTTGGLALAIAPGIGRIERADHESDADFVRRADAMCAERLHSNA